MQSRIIALSVGLVALITNGAAAQDDAVTRRSYPFFADNLTVEVHTESPGVVRLLRGGSGQLEVTGHTPDGVAAFGLGRRSGETLRLSAVGPGRADFLLVVPERVSVTLWLPGNTAPIMARFEPTARYSWARTPGNGPAPSPELPQDAQQTAEAPMAFAASVMPLPSYYAETPPHVVSIPDPANVRRLSIRIEGNDFRVGSSIPLRTIPGNAERLEIRTAGPPVDLVVQLPTDVAGFMLKVGSDVAFAVNEGEARALCSPVVAQHVADGRRWFDFTPRDGRLLCQP